MTCWWYLRTYRVLSTSKTLEWVVVLVITTSSRRVAPRAPSRGAGGASAGTAAGTCPAAAARRACPGTACHPSLAPARPHVSANSTLQRSCRGLLSPALLASSCTYGSGTIFWPASASGGSGWQGVLFQELRGTAADGIVSPTRRSELLRKEHVACVSCGPCWDQNCCSGAGRVRCHRRDRCRGRCRGHGRVPCEGRWREAKQPRCRCRTVRMLVKCCQDSLAARQYLQQTKHNC